MKHRPTNVSSRCNNLIVGFEYEITGHAYRAFDNSTDDFVEVFESEDTLSILNRYIQEAEIQLDKSKVQNIMRQTYQEACELI